MLNDQIAPSTEAAKETFLITVEEKGDVDMKDNPKSIIEIEPRQPKPPPVPEHRPTVSVLPSRKNTASELPPRPGMEVSSKELEDHKDQIEFEKLQGQFQQLNQRYLHSERERERLAKDKENLDKRYESFCQEVSESLRQADDKTEAAEKAQHAWRIEARGIAEELAQCKDELFSLQPRSDVTDTQVAAEWDTLCQQITRWVDDEAEFTSDLITRLKELHSHGQLSPTVEKYWGKDRQLTVNRFRMNDDLDCVLRYNIHCLLEFWVFDEAFYLFGLDKEDSKFLHGLEESLANLRPPRDRVSIDHWRSETINAILGRPNFKDGQGKFAKDVTREAENFITPLLPRMAKGAFSRFHSQITLPAIDFASTLRRSPAHYHFVHGLNQGLHLSSRPALTPLKKPRSIHKAELDRVDVLDIDSRKTLKPNQNLAATREGYVADEIMCIHPALCRRKGDGAGTVLRKPLDLVKLLSPLPRNRKALEYAEVLELTGIIRSSPIGVLQSSSSSSGHPETETTYYATCRRIFLLSKTSKTENLIGIFQKLDYANIAANLAFNAIDEFSYPMKGRRPEGYCEPYDGQNLRLRFADMCGKAGAEPAILGIWITATEGRPKHVVTRVVL